MICLNIRPGVFMHTLKRVQTRAQILEVVRLAREIWTDHYVPIIGQAQVDYMLGKFQSEAAIAAQRAAGYDYFTAWHSDQSVGYLAIKADNDMLLISKVYVQRSCRGKGIGKMMLDFAESICRDRHFKGLWLTVNKHNHSSLAWYEQMGFKNTGSLVQDIGGGFIMDDYRMEKVGLHG